jgi:hypothetical protein
MFADVTANPRSAPGGAPPRPPSAAARAALERFAELSRDVRGGAILADGRVLAATGNGATWEAAARELIEAADAAAGEPAVNAHVATEDGEAYMLRDGALAMVAVTDRFTLASLVLADMRAALRELRAEAARVVAREAA